MLGVIPGVGAMYNGQFVKGFLHVVVFAVLIGITDHYPIFGLFIAAWVFYQSFEAFHTARAAGRNAAARSLWLERGGQLAELGPADSSVSSGAAIAGTGSAEPGPVGYGPAESGPRHPGAAGGYRLRMPGNRLTRRRRRLPRRLFRPSRPSMAKQCAGGRGGPDWPGPVFLLGQLDIFHGRFMEFAWPLILIALGVWLIIRRIEESQGGSK